MKATRKIRRQNAKNRKFSLRTLVFLNIIFLFLASAMFLNTSCQSPQPEMGREAFAGQIMLPRALFITSGNGDSRGSIAPGIVLAIQELNKYGIPVRLESRDILDKKDELLGYNLLILSTAIGYHDADRQYSLTYMSDKELENIRDFVKNGGVLIAGDNVGRNYPDGTDRITVFGQLVGHFGHQIAGDLFADKFVIGFIHIQGINHVVAIGPSVGIGEVEFFATRFGITNHVEPMTGQIGRAHV